jgi:hypothetical protein
MAPSSPGKMYRFLERSEIAATVEASRAGPVRVTTSDFHFMVHLLVATCDLFR